MQSLLDLVGLDIPEFERRMRFLGFTEEDRARLKEIAPFIESISADMIDAFYVHILGFPETARFLQDPALVERLKRAQRAHFIRLATGPYDLEYVESRLRVGLAHARIRLDPQWYLAAYLIQMHFVRGKLFERFAGEPERLQRYITSFWKIVMLDISLATDSYIYGGFVQRSLAEAHAYEAERARAAVEAKQREEEKREELLSMVLHDIRSPVAAIIATARAALRRFRDRSEAPGKQFELVEATGQNVLHIIDNMVSHARAPGGELPINPETFDVADVVRACVSQLLPFVQQTGHSVASEQLEPAVVNGLDKVLVRRVVSNLLVNACRHTPAGSRIDIECGPAEEQGFCRIVVSDDGPGLSSAVREAMFGPLPARPRRTDAYVDSGLGLPFCRMACERMGGRIELSAEGRGARFLITLPMH